MKDRQLLRTLRLENGLVLDFFDASNRYYGDYHRVRVEIRIQLPLQEGLFAGHDEPAPVLVRARRRFGEVLSEERILQRMGVSGRERQEVREALVENFLNTTLPYLRRADYPRRLVARRLAEQAGASPARPRLVS